MPEELMRSVAITADRQIALTRVPIPRLGPDELLIRVRAIGVGIHDSYSLPPISLPRIPSASKARASFRRSDRRSPGV